MDGGNGSKGAWIGDIRMRVLTKKFQEQLGNFSSAFQPNPVVKVFNVAFDVMVHRSGFKI